MRTIIAILFALFFATAAWAETLGNCPLFGATYIFEIGGGQYMLSDFEWDGFGPGSFGTMILRGPGVLTKLHAGCNVSGQIFIAGFPCEPTENGLRCFLHTIDNAKCYNIFGERYCFENEVPILNLVNPDLEKEGE